MVLRNCQTDFYGDEILGEWQKFDEAYFNTIRDGGYTSIWIRGQLRQLVTFEEAPQWDNRNDERLEALNRIVEQGKKSGVGIYLYINEPSGFYVGDPILEKYPDIKGTYNVLSEDPIAVAFQPAYAFCTQCKFTDTYLTEGFARLFAQCPDLAGVIAITASEVHSHCFSNVDELNLMNEDFKHREVPCPRCKQSTSIDTVIDVMTKIRNGIRQSSPTAKIVAWNWSWGMYEASPQPKIIEGLPEDVIVLCDMQRGGSKTVEGIDLVVDEYSFSYLGPSPLFIETAELTQKLERELWAKIMVNVTHEFLVVPYLPLPFRLAKKMIAVRDYDSRGLMGCWNYGGYATTWMAQLGSKIFHDDDFTVNEIDAEVQRISRLVYGEDKAELAYKAWIEFDEAFEYFPFDLFLVYNGPHMHGTGFEWMFTPEEIPMPWYYIKESGRGGTKLADWCTNISPEQVIFLLTKLTDRWKKGVEILAEAFGIEDAFDAVPEFDSFVGQPGFEDFCIARTMYLHFMSTIGFVKFRLATIDYFNNQQREQQEQIILALFEDEKPRIRAMSQIIQAYPKIPEAEEAQKVLYTVEDLDLKLKAMESFNLTKWQTILFRHPRKFRENL